MRYWSDIFNKPFDTKEALDVAEEEYKKEQEAKLAAASAVSKDKKALADVIDRAEEELSSAYDAYYDAREVATKLYEETEEKVAAIFEDSNDKIDNILDTAKKRIEKAQDAKYKAIAEFNKKYGTYTKTFTGEKAKQEFDRAKKVTDTFFDNLFKCWWV